MREEGYYWVKLDGDFIIGYYSKRFNDWEIVGNKRFMGETRFSEIDEKQIKRE